MGLLSQFHVAYSCELMDSKTQYTCCCDVSEGKGCEMGGGCHDQQSATDTDCCDISYETAPGVYAAKYDARSLQVLLLDAPQPPPIDTSLVSSESPRLQLRSGVSFAHPPKVGGTQTYLLTNRFRI